MRVGKHHSLAGRVSLGRVDVLGEQAALCGTRCLPAGSRVRPASDPLRSKRPDRSRRARPSAERMAMLQLRQAMGLCAVALAFAVVAIAGALL